VNNSEYKDTVRGSFSIMHWLILLIVVVFGTAKLKNAGKDLGGAVKGFKDALKDEEIESDHKNRVLSHEGSTSAASNDLNIQVDTRINDIKTSPVSIDAQQNV